MSPMCNREWDAEGVGLLACDLPEGHEGDHLSNYTDPPSTCPNLDHLEAEERRSPQRGKQQRLRLHHRPRPDDGRGAVQPRAARVVARAEGEPMMPTPSPERVIICQPEPECADRNVNRWYCMRGHAHDEKAAVPGVCHLRKCLPSNPKEGMMPSILEAQNITPACRSGRGTDAAWDEAVDRLREIYDAQVNHDPGVTLSLAIYRGDFRDGGR